MGLINEVISDRILSNLILNISISTTLSKVTLTMTVTFFTNDRKQWKQPNGVM